MKVQGRCHCGKIRYEAEVDPGKVGICHCSDCQMLSGSAYRVSVPAPRETFTLTGGPLKVYVKTADSGTRRAHSFCPDCGTPIHSAAVSDPQQFSLRVGCLEQRAELPPRLQIWCHSAVPWSASLDAVPKLERRSTT